MKIINICKPTKYIEIDKRKPNATWYKDLESFYNLLEEVLLEEDIPYKVVDIGFYAMIVKPDSICLAHHINNPPKNVWTIKKGYCAGYLYFDKCGYSGWSEGIINYNPSKFYPNHLFFIRNYIKNNESKIKQPDYTVVPKQPYVLVLMQKPSDTVSKLAKIDTILLSQYVNEVYKDTDINVYSKPHPDSYKMITYGENIKGSIHPLISHAKAVYTVNSGSGFEALMHLKHVYTSGDSDYTSVTTNIETLEDIKNTMNLPGPSELEILNFLNYCFSEHFVNAYSKASILKKINRVLIEYEP